MNAFEMELKKILSQSKEAAHTTYVGRAAYIQVAPELRAKLEFVSLNIANQYNALKLTVLNRIDGAVDINILRFGDLLGKKMVSNPNFSDGVIPHLWDDYGKVSWYVYQPEQADYKLLAGVVDEYNWQTTGKRVKVKDPIYHQDHTFEVWQVEIDGQIHRFAAGEFSNCVWGFYLEKNG